MNCKFDSLFDQFVCFFTFYNTVIKKQPDS